MNRLKKGDQVRVIAGKERGREGTILGFSHDGDRVLVEVLPMMLGRSHYNSSAMLSASTTGSTSPRRFPSSHHRPSGKSVGYIRAK